MKFVVVCSHFEKKTILSKTYFQISTSIDIPTEILMKKRKQQVFLSYTLNAISQNRSDVD